MTLKPTMATNKGKDGLGALRKLAPELRIMVYQQALDEFQQIFEVDAPSNTFWLMSTIQHTTSLKQSLRRQAQVFPNLMSASSELCTEILDSAFSKNSCTIIIGQDRLTTNFPLTIADKLGSRLTHDKALIPTCRELFIGIEMPSPREINAIAQLRLNMKTLVDLLNNIAARTKDNKFPQIRVSFECDSYRAGLMYYRNDFETVVAPLYKLRAPQQDDAYNARRNILIDRSCRWFTLDKRHETCREIENAVQDPATTAKELVYHQLSIDIRLELALLMLHTRYDEVLATPPAAMLARIAVAARESIAWHQKNRFKCPSWIAQLRDICETRSPDLAKLKTVIVGLIGHGNGVVFKQIVCWVNGHLSGANPFWVE